MKNLFFAFWMYVILLAGGCTTITPLTWKLPDGVKTVNANGYPMAYLESGSGTTTVAVHGALCDYRCFQAVRTSLSAESRFVSISLRNSFPEQPDILGPPRSVMQHAADVAAVIEKLNPPVNLIGHSMGGHIAAEVARTRPELVRKLVLVEAGTFTLIPAMPMRQNLAKLSQSMETPLKAGNPEAAAELAANNIAGPGAWGRLAPSLKEMFQANLIPLIHYGRDESSQLRCEEFGALKMPVLLVTGENTGATFKALIEAQAKCLPSAQVARVPNAAHTVQANNPAGFAQAVNAFLR